VLSFTGGLRVFLAVEPADMRKGFEGLHALVGERLGENVRGGALFVFTNRRHTRLKVLYFDGTGLWLMTKRLEEGTFAWPRSRRSDLQSWRCARRRLRCSPTGSICAGQRCGRGLSADEAVLKSSHPRREKSNG